MVVLVLIVFCFIFVALGLLMIDKYSNKRLVIIVLFLIFLGFLSTRYRHFQTVNGVTFTVWNTTEGCYVMPYVYLGLFHPKDDYIIFSNRGGLTIFFKDEKTMLCFFESSDTLNCKINSFNCQVFPQPNYKRRADGLFYYAPIEDPDSHYRKRENIRKRKDQYYILYPSIAIDTYDFVNIYVKDNLRNNDL